jgi:methylmalonyl-CoA mutase cobalamin-binding subunit
MSEARSYWPVLNCSPLAAFGSSLRLGRCELLFQPFEAPALELNFLSGLHRNQPRNQLLTSNHEVPAQLRGAELLHDPHGTAAGRLVITGIEGELYQVGANMVADVFEARGWNVRFLGTNMPQEGILQAVEEHKADVVGISATMLLSIPKAVRVVEDLRQRFQAKCPRILLGGRAFMASTTLVKELRAEGAATDLRSALALM